MPLLHGGQLFLSGLQLALSPELRRYIIVPATIGVLAFSLTLAIDRYTACWRDQCLAAGESSRLAGLVTYRGSDRGIHHPGARGLLVEQPSGHIGRGTLSRAAGRSNLGAVTHHYSGCAS